MKLKKLQLNIYVKKGVVLFLVCMNKRRIQKKLPLDTVCQISLCISLCIKADELVNSFEYINSNDENSVLVTLQPK